MNGTLASAALDLSLVADNDGYNDGRTGKRDRYYSDDFWLFADFDDGNVRLWQVRCTGEHVFKPADRASAGQRHGPLTVHARPSQLCIVRMCTRGKRNFVACSRSSRDGAAQLKKHPIACRCCLQEPPGFRERQPLVPLGLCPGEHAVSGWGVATPPPGSSSSSSSSSAGAGGDDGGRPFISAATSASFVIHSSRTVTSTTAVEGGVEGSGNAGEGGAANGGGGASGDNEACDGSERQPALPGRETQLSRKHGGGGLCRVCAHTLEEKEDRHDDEGFHFSLTSSVFPQGRKRLMLRTSLIATFTADGGGRAAVGGRQSVHGHISEQEEREVEWPVELREGDSPAAAAREFVAERLGLAVRPSETAPEVFPGPGAASSVTEGEQAETSDHITQQEVGGAATAVGERMVQWVTKQLETELAERQVRGAKKLRTEVPGLGFVYFVRSRVRCRVPEDRLSVQWRLCVRWGLPLANLHLQGK